MRAWLSVRSMFLIILIPPWEGIGNSWDVRGDECGGEKKARIYTHTTKEIHRDTRERAKTTDEIKIRLLKRNTNKRTSREDEMRKRYTQRYKKKRNRSMKTMGFVENLKKNGQFNIKPYCHYTHQLPGGAPKTPSFIYPLFLSATLYHPSCECHLLPCPLASEPISIYLYNRRSVSLSRVL